MSQDLRFFFDNAWRRAAGLPDKPPKPLMSDYDVMIKEEWSEDFEKLMRNRLIMGAFRYGSLKEPVKGRYDSIGSAIRRLEKYKETGNDELLVDVANLCLVEYVKGAHPLKHFAGEDDGAEHAVLVKH